MSGVYLSVWCGVSVMGVFAIPRTSLSTFKTSLEEITEHLETELGEHTSTPHIENGHMTSLQTNSHATSSSSYTVPQFFVPNITVPVSHIGVVVVCRFYRRRCNGDVIAMMLVM